MPTLLTWVAQLMGEKACSPAASGKPKKLSV
jgi:hypothetical protein